MIYRYYSQTGGWRFVVLFHEGRKWLKLLETARLEVYRVSKDEFCNLVPYTKIKPKVLARRLRQRRAYLARCNVGFPKKSVRMAISKLEATPDLGTASLSKAPSKNRGDWP